MIDWEAPYHANHVNDRDLNLVWKNSLYLKVVHEWRKTGLDNFKTPPSCYTF